MKKKLGITIPGIQVIKIDKNIIYLDFDDVRNGYCDICLKRKKTTAHHIVPKRASCKHPILKHIRIRICKDCDKWVHPENGKIDGLKIIQKQNKKIAKLKRALDDLIRGDNLLFVQKMNERYDDLIKNLALLPTQIKDKTKIHPTHKLFEGRLKEIKRAVRLYKHLAIMSQHIKDEPKMKKHKCYYDPNEHGVNLVTGEEEFFCPICQKPVMKVNKDD